MPDPGFHAALLRAMGDGVYAVDTQRRITFWNPAAGAISGYPAEVAVGRSCGDGLLNHVDENGTPMCGTSCPLLATMQDGLPRSTRAYLHHADGHVVPVRVSAAALRDESGEIVGSVETFTDDSHQVSVEDRLQEAEQLALVDPLTGLGNRRRLDRSMGRRFGEWERHEHPFAVLAIDVDRLKWINDTHGHDAGDAVLVVIAQSLTSALRTGDEVFRVGGDEFLVLTGPITVEEVAALAARLRMVVSAGRYPGDPPVRATVSIGSALVKEDDAAAAVALRADARLLTAKRSGRDSSVFEPETTHPATARR